MDKYKVARVVRDHKEESISSVDWTSDGNYLLTASDSILCLYNAASAVVARAASCATHGCALARFTHDHLAVLCASRPAGSRIAASAEEAHAIRYLSLHDNAYMRVFTGHTAAVVSLSMSPSADIFASTSVDQTMRLWDLRSPHCIGVTRIEGDARRPVATFDDRGLVLALACAGGLIKLFDPTSMSNGPFESFDISQSLGTPHDFASIAVSKDDSSILLGTAQGACYGVDAWKGELLHTYTGYANGQGFPLEATYSHDGKAVLCGSEDGSIWRWDAQAGNALGEPLVGHGEPLALVRCNPTRQLVVGASASAVSWWLPVSSGA